MLYKAKFRNLNKNIKTVKNKQTTQQAKTILQDKVLTILVSFSLLLLTDSAFSIVWGKAVTEGDSHTCKALVTFGFEPRFQDHQMALVSRPSEISSRSDSMIYKYKMSCLTDL